MRPWVRTSGHGVITSSGFVVCTCGCIPGHLQDVREPGIHIREERCISFIPPPAVGGLRVFFFMHASRPFASPCNPSNPSNDRTNNRPGVVHGALGGRDATNLEMGHRAQSGTARSRRPKIQTQNAQDLFAIVASTNNITIPMLLHTLSLLTVEIQVQITSRPARDQATDGASDSVFCSCPSCHAACPSSRTPPRCTPEFLLPRRQTCGRPAPRVVRSVGQLVWHWVQYLQQPLRPVLGSFGFPVYLRRQQPPLGRSVALNVEMVRRRGQREKLRQRGGRDYPGQYD